MTRTVVLARKASYIIVFAIIIVMLMLVTVAMIPYVSSKSTLNNQKSSNQKDYSQPVKQASVIQEPYRFVVMADSRGSYNGVNDKVLRRVMGHVKRISPQPRAIFFAGDMVGGGLTVHSQLSHWKDVMDDYYPLKMIFPALGNHERSASAFTNAFSYLPNENVTGLGRTIYSIDQGNIRFLVLNSEINHKVAAGQRSWLRQKLTKNPKKFNFVFFHQPAYPTSSHVGSSLDVHPLDRDFLWDILDKNNATMVFVGHEHNYTRRHIDQAMSERASGVRFSFKRNIFQVTPGSAGAPLTRGFVSKKNVDVPPKPVYNFAIVDVTGNSVSVKVYDDKGTTIDSFKN